MADITKLVEKIIEAVLAFPERPNTIEEVTKLLAPDPHECDSCGRRPQATEPFCSQNPNTGAWICFYCGYVDAGRVGNVERATACRIGAEDAAARAIVEREKLREENDQLRRLMRELEGIVE